MRGFGPARIHRIHARARNHGLSVSDIFALPQEEFETVFSPKGLEIYRALHQEDEDAVYRQYIELIDSEICVIHPDHESYPVRLLILFLDSAPAVIFARGKVDLMKARSIAIVGSREAGGRALELSAETAAAAADSGWNVVSGYARGIDTAAHLGALKAGGTTTMVIPLGIDRFVPRTSLKDLPWMSEGLIISQFHPQDGWKNSYGAMRNKLIVGLSQAVVVVQAAAESGTMHTGELALKAGVPLFALSEKALGDVSEGNVRLLAQGAKKVDKVEEIIERLNHPVNKTPVLTGSKMVSSNNLL